MNNYSEITKVLKLRQAMGFIYALCATVLCGVLPYLRFGLESLRSLLWDIFLLLDASGPLLHFMLGCLYSGLQALYSFVWDALFLFAASRPHLSLMLSLLRDQSHGFWAGLLVGCFFTTLPGLSCLFLGSLLLCAFMHFMCLHLCACTPVLSGRCDTQDVYRSAPVILPVHYGSTHAFAPVIPPVRPAIAPVVPPLVLTVGLVPTPALTSVFLPVKPALVPKLLPWLTADQIFHLIVVLFLDSYEVLFTNVKLSKYLTYNQRIVAWYEQHKRLQAQGRFVPDPAMSTVRTSRGDVVYPDPGSVMLVQHTSLYPTRLVDGAATFSAASHRDLDSLYCTYCNKRRHEVVSCYKKWKDEKKALKHLGAQPSNNWGWGSC